MKTYLPLFLLLFIGTSAFAQPHADFRKNRIYTGGSLLNLKNVQLRNGPTGYNVKSSFSLNGLLGYERRFNERWSLGVDYYITTTGMLLEDAQGNEFSAATGISSLQLKTRYTWHSKYKEGFRYRFYSGLGLGTRSTVVIVTDGTDLADATSFGLGAQLDVIGAEMAWRWFGLWAEAGHGVQGQLKMGMSFNF
jgi:hypothetical protein